MDEGLSSTENLKGFIEIILPLLIECWIEALPPQLAASVGNSVEREPLQVMQQVLNIISLLWKLSKQHDETHKLVRTNGFFIFSVMPFIVDGQIRNQYVFTNWLYIFQGLTVNLLLTFAQN